ncbi:Putative CRAL-TRIO lipid binding domain, CRAL/TRIO domain, CRAL/TRIO domain superfamily [Septoria linicola]|uniref:CRAL-TRIO lipid binding domain, CRAL/TRIO domain, CRAL/TRIO domain superfamily n=1 Tax=Septoria linicola TaxID=215465 RepID=A0A9Q9EGX5_9PEZI|nr:putative CRAL-TRIO lipid binding domain, CRAL/TRIO domain, CRAL/TRIO domain superfamily [Septoria linicola]USW50445.1 Putative CRAL-TRIO lipid binding domain, CRAL/TRIO domain, CRAL/TRIO domain superfamily [Septoria linicola]
MAEVAGTGVAQNGNVLQEKGFVEQNGTATPADPSRAASVRSAESFNSVASGTTPASSAVVVGEEWKAPTDGPVKTPIPRPAAGTTPSPQAALTPEQETKYATVLAQVSQWTTVPASTAKNAAQAPIEDRERMFLTRECILRYLRATKWVTADALKRLQGTLSWRREYGADTFTHDYISPENETGKQVQLGFDKDQRPCLYLSPARQNTKMSDRQIHHLCYMLDRTIEMMPAGQESNCLIVNFKGAKSGAVPSLGQAQAVLNILQTHNPERLGRALITDTPWYVNAFFKLISSFIDPVTREKMKFNEDMKNYIPKEQLWDVFGGDITFDYDHSVYWPAFEAEFTERREAYRKRWESGGKQIGEYETYLRGGNHPSLQQTLQATKENEKPAAVAHAEAADADVAAAGVAKLTV